jgi:serine phosphatase RsbU (regulator of sigma subunit)
MLELYIVAKDSIGSNKTKQNVIRQEFKYEYEKQHFADSLAFVKEQDMKELQHQNQLEKEQNQRYYLYVGIVFLLLLGSIVLRGYQRKKKDHEIISLQKTEVENQKDIVEEKNQEILDSIIYAKRIQNAILPQDKLVEEHLKDSFILYKPKDIVAGDFYWLEHKNGKVLFAAADCTGHGVPGAMVSVVCNNGLNRSVREYGLTDPGQILDKTREIVIQEFAKSEEDVKDGMDIAICVIENNQLHYAGANIPLWIIRNGEILETKANKQPIGKFDNPEPYTTHSFEMLKGDTIYIFSDGYVDQFGGEKSKKFKIRAFRDLLLSIQDKSMKEQMTLIDENFEVWKDNNDQVDDVCVIGVRI